jgi:hypothetical protein
MTFAIPELATAFMLTFARIGTLVMLMPGIGERMISARLRLGFPFRQSQGQPGSSTARFQGSVLSNSRQAKPHTSSASASGARAQSAP